MARRACAAVRSAAAWSSTGNGSLSIRSGLTSGGSACRWRCELRVRPAPAAAARSAADLPFVGVGLDDHSGPAATLAACRFALRFVAWPFRVLPLQPRPLARPVRLVESLGDDPFKPVLPDCLPERGRVVEARAEPAAAGGVERLG